MADEKLTYEQGLHDGFALGMGAVQLILREGFQDIVSLAQETSLSDYDERGLPGWSSLDAAAKKRLKRWLEQKGK